MDTKMNFRKELKKIECNFIQRNSEFKKIKKRFEFKNDLTSIIFIF